MKMRALVLASVASMIDQFNLTNIQLLQSIGYQVDIAADFTNPGNITNERAETLKFNLENKGSIVYDIAIPRTLNPRLIFQAYKKTKMLIDEEEYSLLHCHSPIGGAIARFAGREKRKKGLRIIYTAHGFHFYKGAPMKNWIIFYWAEKWLSRYTDVLITINKEDYKRAKENFNANRVEYVPGVGIDVDKFKQNVNGRLKVRRELGINDNRIILLSVGELNENKNHESVIRAIEGVKNITYVVVGRGDLRNRLIHLADECDVDLRLMGYRNDVADFYKAADAYILPSLREGLNVSLMEAMASSLPCLASKIRGNVDLIDQDEGGVLFCPKDVRQIKKALQKIIYMSNEERYKLGKYNLDKIRVFDLKTVRHITYDIYDAVD